MSRRYFLMAALPLMLEEAQFAADFMELYQPPERAPALKLPSPSSKVYSCSFAHTTSDSMHKILQPVLPPPPDAACCGLTA
jgi:hypothetical protein